MVASERNLRMVILVVYGVALSHMLWTGEVYRFVGGWLAPWLWICCGVLWLLTIAGFFAGRHRSHVFHSVQESGLAETKTRWQWAQGTLYAIFVLPPLIYLIGLLTGDLRWF